MQKAIICGAFVALVTVVNVLSGAQPTTPEKSKDIAAETGIVEVGDASIEYFTRGKGPAIVLLPGGTLTVAESAAAVVPLTSRVLGTSGTCRRIHRLMALIAARDLNRRLLS